MGNRRQTIRSTSHFSGDVDGSADAFLQELADRTATGLAELFAHCEGFERTTPLLNWMRRHGAPAGAAYMNWKGRTMLQIREEAALREAMERYLDENADAVSSGMPGRVACPIATLPER